MSLPDYFELLCEFTRTLRSSISEPLSENDIASLSIEIAEIQRSAQQFDDAWTGSHEDHPNVCAFLTSQKSSMDLALRTSDPRARSKILHAVYSQLSDFLFGHGRRFGYPGPGVSNADDMWKTDIQSS